MFKLMLGASLVLASVGSAVMLPTQTNSNDNEAEINAGDYKSLQSAFDAVPETGGRVVIPSGTYEITAPLRLNKGDVRIEGSGNSTHIINLNEDGKPDW